MAQHQWVKHTVEPISVVEVEQEDPEYFLDPGRPTEVMFGCAACNALLTLEAVRTDCAGEASEPLALRTTTEAVMIDTYADEDD